MLEPAKPQRAVSASTKRRPRDRSRGPLAFRYVFQGIIDTTSDLVAAHDLRGRYIAFNEAYRAEFGRIFGVELKVGDSMMDALSHLPRDQTNAFDIVQRALRGDAFTLLAEFGDESGSRGGFTRSGARRSATGAAGSSAPRTPFGTSPRNTASTRRCARPTRPWSAGLPNEQPRSQRARSDSAPRSTISPERSPSTTRTGASNS